LIIVLRNEWKDFYPDSHVGFLVAENVTNPATITSLEQEKIELENSLRQKYASYDRKMLEQIPQIQIYSAFYKQFNKTYHVRNQLESVVFKGKSVPSMAALVEVMFMAELKNLLLTAGHDLDLLKLPIEVGIAEGTETLMQFSEQVKVLKPGDMMMMDQQGILSSVVYGPDRRFSIRAETTRVMYAVYAPGGISIDILENHLVDIRRYLMLVSPDIKILMLDVFP
jgi:DNA/RNA-binding domain of Phe-tRNA-synthetase-like protein